LWSLAITGSLVLVCPATLTAVVGRLVADEIEISRRQQLWDILATL
jgi:hypothetical protein